MSGETKSNVSPWTIDSLKEHFEQRLLDQEKAIEKEEGNAEKWRESANEWRQSMLDREVKFAQRTEVEAEFKAIRSEIQSLRETRAEGIGSKQFLLLILAIIGAMGTLTAIYLATKT